MALERGIKYVYLIQALNGLTKIGHSANVEKRFEDIDRISPIDLKLFGYIESPFAREIECELHYIFRDKRIRYEWFELTSEDIDYIKENYSFVEIKIIHGNVVEVSYALGQIVSAVNVDKGNSWDNLKPKARR